MSARKRTFKAVAWNVLHSTKVPELAPILQDLIDDGVTMFLMNEAGGNDITQMLTDHELSTVAYGQWRIAWDPKVWRLLNHKHRRTGRWYIRSKRTGRSVPYLIKIARFKHLPSGKKLKAISYHTPAHVQKPIWNRNAPNRWRILKATMAIFREIAAGRARYILAGGDDNVDERHGSRDRWRFMLNTGLQQIQPPRPTKGRRKIDDFRIKGLIPLGGYVGDGGGDHKYFVLRLRFKTFLRKN